MAMKVPLEDLVQLSRDMARDTGGNAGENLRDLIVNGYPDIDSGGIEPVIREFVTMARANPAVAPVGFGVLAFVGVGLGVVLAWKKFRRVR